MLTFISEVLSPDQRIKEVRDHEYGDDETEYVRGAHMRSTPSISSSRIANATIPIAMATMSMDRLWTGQHHGRMTIPALRITIS